MNEWQEKIVKEWITVVNSRKEGQKEIKRESEEIKEAKERKVSEKEWIRREMTKERTRRPIPKKGEEKAKPTLFLSLVNFSSHFFDKQICQNPDVEWEFYEDYFKPLYTDLAKKLTERCKGRTQTKRRRGRRKERENN